MSNHAPCVCPSQLRPAAPAPCMVGCMAAPRARGPGATKSRSDSQSSRWVTGIRCERGTAIFISYEQLIVLACLPLHCCDLILCVFVRSSSRCSPVIGFEWCGNNGPSEPLVSVSKKRQKTKNHQARPSADQRRGDTLLRAAWSTNSDATNQPDTIRCTATSAHSDSDTTVPPAAPTRPIDRQPAVRRRVGTRGVAPPSPHRQPLSSYQLILPLSAPTDPPGLTHPHPTPPTHTHQRIRIRTLCLPHPPF